MSANQPMELKPIPAGAGDEKAAREGTTDPNEPGAQPIVDLGEARIDADPAYQDDVPVGADDADEDARQAGGER
jgi:hypothetical protein